MQFDRTGLDLLLKECENGSLERIKRVFDRLFVNMSDTRGRTPLYVAIANKRYDVVRFLLGENAKINVSCGDTMGSIPPGLPWDFVLASGDERLIRAFADGIKDEDLVTMIEAAERMGKFGEIRVILSGPFRSLVSSGLLDQYGRSALHYAALYGDSKVMKQLLGYDGVADWEFSAETIGTIDMRDNLGNTSLHLAAEKGNVDAMRFLMEHGADVKAENKAGETPLYCSVKSGNVHAIDFMLGHRVEPYDREALLTLVGAGQDNVKEYLQDKFREVDNSDATSQMRM